MEDGTPKGNRPWIAFIVKFPHREREVLSLIIQHNMINESGVFKDSFIVQS